MNDHQVATAAQQNSAYRHRNYEGRFRKRRRPSLLSVTDALCARSCRSSLRATDLHRQHVLAMRPFGKAHQWKNCADDNDQPIFPSDLRRFIVAPHVIAFSNAHRSLRLAGLTDGTVPSKSGHRWRELGFFAKERKHFFHECIGCDAVLLS